MSQKRRNYSPQFKFETVMEGLRGEKTVAEICRERDIKESLYYKWRDQFLEDAPSLFADKRRKSEPGGSDAEQRIAELERMVGRLTMENAILKKAESWLSSNRKRNGQ
jgi:transposase